MQVGLGLIVAILITLFAYFKGVPPANIALGWLIYIIAMIVISIVLGAAILG